MDKDKKDVKISLDKNTIDLAIDKNLKKLVFVYNRIIDAPLQIDDTEYQRQAWLDMGVDKFIVAHIVKKVTLLASGCNVAEPEEVRHLFNICRNENARTMDLLMAVAPIIHNRRLC